MLLDEGHSITIAFANPNIQPRDEYDRRLEVLRTWAQDEGLPVVDLPYELDMWQQRVGALEEAGCTREQRCRACYALRLEQAAAYAAEHDFEALSTTLAVSPYQFSQTCHEELEQACKRFNLTCIWQDFRPYYAFATKRSRELGMYRQNYCGCVYSKAEAEAEREERKAAKAEAAALREAELEEQRKQRAMRQASYDAKQAAKRAARKAWRQALHDDDWQG